MGGILCADLEESSTKIQRKFLLQFFTDFKPPRTYINYFSFSFIDLIDKINIDWKRKIYFFIARSQNVVIKTFFPFFSLSVVAFCRKGRKKVKKLSFCMSAEKFSLVEEFGEKEAWSLDDYVVVRKLYNVQH